MQTNEDKTSDDNTIEEHLDNEEQEDKEEQPTTPTTSDENPSPLTSTQKRRVVTVLFGRLIKMHKNIMNLLTFIHALVILSVGLHMLVLGTIESENNSCFLTWPLMHLFYMFVNYVFAWFFCYNSCEISGRRGLNSLTASKRFLKVLFIFGLSPLPLRLLATKYCRNWTISLNASIMESSHILLETIFMFIYFSWFERKYKGFRIFYRETIV